MGKTTAIYVRVSHRDQSHASQLPDLEHWVEAHDVSVEWFKDTFTGRTLDRPGMTSFLRSFVPVGSAASWCGVSTGWAGPPEGSASYSTTSGSGTSIWFRSRTGSASTHLPVGSTLESWRPSPSTRPRSGRRGRWPVRRSPAAKARPGVAPRRAGGGRSPTSRSRPSGR